MTRMIRTIQSLTFLLVILASAVCCYAKDDAVQKALEDARRYAAAGEYAKALERHEWVHENALSISRSFYGVRLSFALSGWTRLGDQYPPALASLKAVRDANVRALREGKSSREGFHDISAINRQLGEDEATLRLFKELHEKDPALARKCFPIIQDDLLSGGEEELFVQYAGDLPAYMKMRVERYRDLTGHLKSAERPGMKPVLKHFDNKLVNTALRLMELAKGDPAKVQKIRETASDAVDDPRLAAP